MPRRKGDTKEKIIEKSLKLFSEHGYEAVSIRTIADEVGIGNSALYKHFKSKQEIFDSIVEKSKERYLEKCSGIVEKIDSYEQMRQNCIDMFLYQTTDEWIVRFRQILLLEKFHNKQMAEIYKEFFVDMPLNSQRKIFELLQKQGIMIPGDTSVYAMEFFAPFYLYHFVEYEKKDVIPLLENHITSFWEQHFIER